ncbi:MAG: serine--tRNA ligase [Pseudomonadota bacterium]
MFDIKWIRENPQAFDEGIAKRGLEPQADALIALDESRRSHLQALQDAQERRNAASKLIGQAKAKGDEEAAQAAIAEVAEVKAFIQGGEDKERELTAALRDALSVLPNLPLDDVPEGEDEADNALLKTVGEKPEFGFEPKEHFDLGEATGQMDFNAASKLAGSRFSLLNGPLARLARALGQYMIDTHTEQHGYTETYVPLLVRDHALFGTSQLPKFEEDLFKTTDDRYLIPTAEVPLTNLVAGEIVSHDYLPRRYTALTPCFRSEAGSAGRDTRGMLRQHQFEKVELVSVIDAESGEAELERMLGCAEAILTGLGLHYRVMTLCTGDMGFGARKTYDIEVWLPGQDAYREISSCSYCGDFQARRMNARYRKEGEKATTFLHTLNGSGVAVGRALIAVIENYQREDGSIAVPDALQPYMGGTTEIAV